MLSPASDVPCSLKDPRPSWVALASRRLDSLSPDWPALVGEDRPAAVLALLTAEEDPELVLTLRAGYLDHHAGQISLPGGGREAGDVSPVDTALRETAEEIGLPASAVRPLGQLSTLQISVSRNQVIPIVGLWSGNEPLTELDATEVEAVIRWRVSLLADPAHRVMARHPRGGHGPAWQIGELFLWGFTGVVVDALLRVGGWERDWDHTRLVEVPPRFSGHP